MGKPLQPCGTHAAYRRHLRAGEQPCEPCMQAMRDQKMNRVDGDRSKRSVEALLGAKTPTEQPAAAPTAAPEPAPEDLPDDGPIDPVKDARANLRIVNLALENAVPREVAALSKRRQELVAYIADLQGKDGETTIADEIAAARERRAATA